MDMKYEIKKRLNQEDDIYNAIGAEIKSHRLALSKTLQSIADKNCSVSYLCKVERNQIKPSQYHLREIFKKVEIPEDKIEYLLSSRELLINAVKSFFFKDLDYQKNSLFKLNGLDNHRVELIRFIYACTRNNESESKRCIKKLWGLAGNLANLDLMIFAAFYGIFQYSQREYIEAAEYLKLSLEFDIKIKYLRPIILGYLFMCAKKSGSIATTEYYMLINNELIEYGSALDLEMIHYEMCLYYLHLKQYRQFSMVLTKLAKQEHAYNLDLIRKIILDEKTITSVEEDKLDDLGKIYYYIYIGKTNLLEFINYSKLRIEDKDYLIYRFYKKYDLEKAYDYLVTRCLPYAEDYKLAGYFNYYLYEYVNSLFRPNKYKAIIDLYLEAKRIEELVNQI